MTHIWNCPMDADRECPTCCFFRGEHKCALSPLEAIRPMPIPEADIPCPEVDCDMCGDRNEAEDRCMKINKASSPIDPIVQKEMDLWEKTTGDGIIPSKPKPKNKSLTEFMKK